MRTLDVLHIPIIALIHIGLLYLWNLKIQKRVIQDRRVWLFYGFGAFFNVWGIDVVHRAFMVDSFKNMLIMSTGCWLVFVAATTAKYYAIYGWSKTDFWLDYGGDLMAFLISGSFIYLAT